MGWMKIVFTHIEDYVANKAADAVIGEVYSETARCRKCGKLFPSECLKEHEKECEYER